MTDAQDDDVQLVLASYEAFARGDIAGAVAQLDPQVQWLDPGETPGGTLVGPQAVAHDLAISRQRWQQFRSMPIARRRGERIIVEHHIEGVLVDGSRHSTTVADVYTVRDGLILTVHSYADPTDVPD